MAKQKNPSLARIYTLGNDASHILYLDETYCTPKENKGETFYIITASFLQNKDIIPLREDLRHIAKGDYWRSTAALNTELGRKKFTKLCQYMAQRQIASFIVCKEPIPKKIKPKNPAHPPKPEDAVRQACLRKLLRWVNNEVDDISGIVFPERKPPKSNATVRNVLRGLEKDPSSLNDVPHAWVSPREEKALWLPDIVCTTYRRTRTHSDGSENYFFDYLNDIVEIQEF